MARKPIQEISDIYWEEYLNGGIHNYYDLTIQEVKSIIDKLMSENYESESDRLFNAIQITKEIAFYYGYRCAINHKKQGKKSIF